MERMRLRHQLRFFMALLGLLCVRLSTILSIDIPDARGMVAPNHGWVEVGGPNEDWWLHWPSATVKGGTTIRTRVPSILRPRLLRHLNYYRPALRGSLGNAALFVSRLTGRRWSGGAARKAFQDALEHRFKKRVWPHLVRSANAAFVCEDLPDRVLAGMLPDLLAHSNVRSQEAYKTLVRGEGAQKRLEQAANKKLDELSRVGNAP